MSTVVQIILKKITGSYSAEEFRLYGCQKFLSLLVILEFSSDSIYFCCIDHFWAKIEIYFSTSLTPLATVLVSGRIPEFFLIPTLLSLFPQGQVWNFVKSKSCNA